MYRQGEVLLIPVSEYPADYQVIKARRATLAIGETGNAHVIEKTEVDWLVQAAEDIAKIEQGGVGEASHAVFVRLFKPGQIVHSDRTDGGHTPIDIPAGTYEVRVKREINPFTEEVRNVWD